MVLWFTDLTALTFAPVYKLPGLVVLLVVYFLVKSVEKLSKRRGKFIVYNGLAMP